MAASSKPLVLQSWCSRNEDDKIFEIRADAAHFIARVTRGGPRCPGDVGASAALGAAAPRLLRAILLSEWGYDGAGVCPACGGLRSTSTTSLGHERRCAIDVELVFAEFYSHEQRDAARAMIERSSNG